MAALAPGSAPPDPAVTLCAVEHDLRMLAWGLGGGKGKRPERLMAGTLAEQVSVSEIERVATALGIGIGEG